MPELDRGRLIEVLNQLGDGNDAAALAAAREANRLVAESGRGWAELIPSSESAAPRVTAPARSTSADTSDTGKIIDRLLAQSDISDVLRGDLNEFKRALGDGKLDKMDADYVRALGKRLGA